MLLIINEAGTGGLQHATQPMLRSHSELVGTSLMGLCKAAPHTFEVFGKDNPQSASPHQKFAIVFMKSCMPVTDDHHMSCLLYTQGHMTLFTSTCMMT